MINSIFERFKKMNTVTLVVILLILIPLTSVFLIIMRVESYGNKYILSFDDLAKHQDFDAILVLGAGLTDDNTPSDILTDRLLSSLKAYELGASNKFILSGDHGRENYNEVKAMKKFILQSNNTIDESNIFLDHAGFSTYESMYRAKEIFKAKKILIITNEYHLPRALYIARNLGITAYGVPSDIRNYLNIISYSTREKLAQIKDFININFIKPEPTFLGDPIPVNSSNGLITDDDN